MNNLLLTLQQLGVILKLIAFISLVMICAFLACTAGAALSFLSFQPHP